VGGCARRLPLLDVHGDVLVPAGRLSAVIVASLRGRWASERRDGRRLVPGALLVLTLAAIAVLTRPVLAPSEDALDHIGHVRRAVTFDTLRPDGILALPEDASAPLPRDPRKGSLHGLLAVITELSGSDATTTWVWLPTIIFPVAVLAFASFASNFVGGGAMFAACMALFALSYGGTGLQFAPTAAYGQNLAATWYWVIAALSRRAMALGLTRARAAALAVLCAGNLHSSGVAVRDGLACTLAAWRMAAMPRGLRGSRCPSRGRRQTHRAWPVRTEKRNPQPRAG
jgi:hypothetical protein